jgi:uncharacterized protein YigA (DUF484 family)
MDNANAESLPTSTAPAGNASLTVKTAGSNRMTSMSCEYDAASCVPAVADENSDSQRVEEILERILRAQNRLEQIRSNFDQVDRIALTCRTVAGLIESVTRQLENSLDLLSVRILLAKDGEIAGILDRCVPYGSGIINQDSLAFGESPEFMNAQDVENLQKYFGDVAENIGSAVLVPLISGDSSLGMLCLASGECQRYSEPRSTVLLQGLADKISLGLLNALDHETAARSLLFNDEEAIFSEFFFHEYLQKEFNRSWRSHRPFNVMAISWENSDGADLTSLFRRNLRSMDVVATGELLKLWVLMPETEANEAEKIAQRLIGVAEEACSGVAIRIGMCEFSKSAATMPMLLKRAKEALDEAIQYKLTIVNRTDGK